jgi:hypothetical protein
MWILKTQRTNWYRRVLKFFAFETTACTKFCVSQSSIQPADSVGDISRDADDMGADVDMGFIKRY